MTRDHADPGGWRTAFVVNTVLVQALTFVLRPTAAYRALELDLGTAWLGVLGATFALVPLVVALPLGRWVDRVGERTVVLVGAVLTFAAAATLLLGARTLAGLTAGFALLGVGHLASVMAQQALVANRAEPRRYDQLFGHYTFAASLGQAVGPLLIVALGGSQAIPDTRAIFAWSTGGALLLVATALPLPRVHPRADRRTHSGSTRELLRRPGLVRALSVSAVVQAAVDIVIVYLPALGTERSISAGAVGALLTVRAVASMASRLFLGQLVAAVGRGSLLTASVALAAASTALLPFAPNLGALVAVAVAMGLGLGCGQPLTMSWLAEASPDGQRGRAMSLRLTGNRLGQVLLPSTAGVLAVGTGAAGVLCATGAVLAAAAFASRGIGGPSTTA